MLPLERTDLDTRITKEANQPRGTTVGMTLSDILWINGKKYPHSNAISFEGEKASFRELDERVSRRANALLDLGVRKGDHVATLSHNSLALIESVFAIFRAGAVLVPLNVRLSPQELAHILNHSDAKMIVFSAAFEDTVRKIAPAIKDAVRLICFGRKHSSEFIDLDARASEQSTDFPAVEIQERDTATILYTAGTTGKPKGVVASHENWIWSCINCIVALSLTPQLKSLITYPLFHVAAFLNLFSIIFIGSSLRVPGEFEPRRVLELVEKEKISRLGNPPTVHNMILQVPDIAKYDLSSVRYINFGAEIMPEEARQRLQKVFPRAGLLDNYGLTETCSLVSSRPEAYTEKPYSVGIPVLSVEMRLVDEKGKDVLCRHPKVLEVAVFGVPDKTWGRRSAPPSS